MRFLINRAFGQLIPALGIRNDLSCGDHLTLHILIYFASFIRASQILSFGGGMLILTYVEFLT